MDVEQVHSGGGENRHTTRAAGIELALEVRAHALDVLSQLELLVVGQRILSELAFNRVEQGLELRRALAQGRKLTGVEVQIEAEDLVTLGPQRRQLA